MSVQRVLARLSPLLVVSDRTYIPSFSSTTVRDPTTRPHEHTWSSILLSCPPSPLPDSFLKHARVVMFGEQHHQSQVLRAQMQVLHSLHRIRKDTNRVVMVLEHFNFLQSPLLAQFSAGDIDDDALIREYAKGNEGFQLIHYLPLLHLAKELGVTIVGGFPPREWASVVYKESIRALRERVGVPEGFDEERWTQVTRIRREQVAYLKSMMNGHPPSLSEAPEEGYGSGILPAQTLKDTFFAWSIDELLEDDEVVVFAVCGLGHGEYGICASDRILGCGRDQICLIASKEWQSGEYVGDEPAYTDSLKLADVIVPYHADKDTRTTQEME